LLRSLLNHHNDTNELHVNCMFASEVVVNCPILCGPRNELFENPGPVGNSSVTGIRANKWLWSCRKE